MCLLKKVTNICMLFQQAIYICQYQKRACLQALNCVCLLFQQALYTCLLILTYISCFIKCILYKVRSPQVDLLSSSPKYAWILGSGIQQKLNKRFSLKCAFSNIYIFTQNVKICVCSSKMCLLCLYDQANVPGNMFPRSRVLCTSGKEPC